MKPYPVTPPASRSANSNSILYALAAALAAAWFLTFRLLLAHDPLARALQMGADLAKEHALKAIPQEWMGWLAQPVIQMINQYVGPHALAGEAFMTTWAFILTLLLPAAFLLLGLGIVHGVLMLGGAPGGWKGTARAFLVNHACADLACLAWIGLLLAILHTRYSILSFSFLLIGGLLFIRFLAHAWLLVSLARAHSLGAFRIIFLGIPALLIATVFAWLVATATGSWLICDLVLSALR